MAYTHAAYARHAAQPTVQLPSAAQIAKSMLNGLLYPFKLMLESLDTATSGDKPFWSALCFVIGCSFLGLLFMAVIMTIANTEVWMQLF